MWAPGERTHLHGHPGARSYTLVLSGIFREFIARLDGRDSQRTLYVGRATVIDDCIGAHAWYSVTGGITLHVTVGTPHEEETYVTAEEPTYLGYYVDPVNAANSDTETDSLSDDLDDDCLWGVDGELLDVGAADA